MNKMLIVAALALVASSPLAFAAKSTPLSNPSVLTTAHCTYLAQDFAHDRAKFKSPGALQTAEDNAAALCRQDKDQRAGLEFGVRSTDARAVS